MIREGDRRRPAIKFRLKMGAKLTDANLAEAALRMESQELKFVVRWFSAYRPDYVVANWRPGPGFEFFEGNLAREMTADGKLEIYPAPAPGRKAIPGKVKVNKGVIVMKIPYGMIQDFDLGRNKTKKPSVGSAKPGDRIYEVIGFTFGRPQGSNAPGVLDYYNQADSTPPFDFKLKRPRALRR